MNATNKSGTYGELVLKVGLPPSKPGKPVITDASFAAQTIDISWLRPSEVGGWPILTFEVWVDDGAGTWPAVPISLEAS